MDYEDYQQFREVWISILWWRWRPYEADRVIDFTHHPDYWIMKGILIGKDLDVASFSGKPVTMKIFNVELTSVNEHKFSQWIDPGLCHNTEIEAYNKIRSSYNKELADCTQYCENQIELIKNRIFYIDVIVKKYIKHDKNNPLTPFNKGE